MKIRFSERAKMFQASEIRNKLFDDPEIITFAAGKPDGKLFPLKEAAEVLQEVIKERGEIALQYSETEGFSELREIIAEQRMKARGVNAAAEDITLTSGSQQGIEYSAKIFVNDGDIILCESPSYVGALNAFASYMPQCIGIPMDENGMIIEELEKKLKQYPNAKMIYTIPDFQNPTGVTMSDDRRKRLAELAAEYEIPVIEDCPYGDLIYEGNPHPSVKSFDKEGWVVFLGSFSKILSPGLRIGWVCATKEILQKYMMAKQCSDLQCGSLDEQLAIGYMKKYDLAEHIEEIRDLYRERRDLMLECIDKYFPAEVKHTRPHGGFFVWLELKDGLNANELLVEAAQKKKVAFVPGGSFFTEGGHKNFIRLSFSFVDNDKIVEGMKRLGELISEHY
ncbi:MAG: PLP-dependent aminotransferase family protein [Clostridiaceae bacterium]